MTGDGYDWFDDDRFDGGKIPKLKFVYQQRLIDTLFQPKSAGDVIASDTAWKLAAEAIKKAKAP